MGETWDEIWHRKGLERTEDLKLLNGYERTTFDHAQAAAIIVRDLSIQPGGRLLDVGCGAGALGDEILKLVPGTAYAGTDRSASMVQTHIRIFGRSVLNFSAADPVFSDSFFDYGVCYGVFFYFPSATYAREAMRQLLRQARDVYIGDLPVTSHDSTHLLFTQEQVAGWLETDASPAARWRFTDGLYNPLRFNVVIQQETGAPKNVP